MSIATISPTDLQARIARGEKPLLVDVRSPAEHAAVHVPGVVLMPLERLDPQSFPRDGGTAYLLCQAGGRATRAAETLTSAGITCCVVTGGTSAWAAAGLPVNRGRGVISIERQVRIGAGLVVVIGVTLGLSVHPGFVGLAGFVGAGLIFAGITDWCGMGLLLAKAPWNQRTVTATAHATPAAGGSKPSCCSK
jgi:rhodanese-related sulfurtransferase